MPRRNINARRVKGRKLSFSQMTKMLNLTREQKIRMKIYMMKMTKGGEI